MIFGKGEIMMLNKVKFQNVVNSLLQGEEVEKFLEFRCEGFKLNPDKKYALGIIEGIKRSNLHCPCKVQKTEENLCPCDDFVNTGKCCCKLWVEK